MTSKSEDFSIEIDCIFERLVRAHERVQTNDLPANQIIATPSYIDFSSAGNGTHFQIFGWDNPEANFTWTIGLEAYLNIPAPKWTEPMFLNVKMDSYRFGPLHEQTVSLWANHVEIAHWTVRRPGHYFAIIPSRLFSQDTLELKFQIPHASSPKTMGQSSDDRPLGLSFEALWISPATGIAV